MSLSVEFEPRFSLLAKAIKEAEIGRSSPPKVVKRKGTESSRTKYVLSGGILGFGLAAGVSSLIALLAYAILHDQSANLELDRQIFVAVVLGTGTLLGTGVLLGAQKGERVYREHTKSKPKLVRSKSF